MQTRQAGQTGLSVTRLGLGLAALGRRRPREETGDDFTFDLDDETAAA